MRTGSNSGTGPEEGGREGGRNGGAEDIVITASWWKRPHDVRLRGIPPTPVDRPPAVDNSLTRTSPTSPTSPTRLLPRPAQDGGKQTGEGDGRRETGGEGR